MSEWDGETINTETLEWMGYPECGDLDIDIKEESLDYGEELESSHDRDLSSRANSIPGNLESMSGSDGHPNCHCNGMNDSVQSDPQEHYVNPEPPAELDLDRETVVSKNSTPGAIESLTSRQMDLINSNTRLCELGCDYRQKYINPQLNQSSQDIPSQMKRHIPQVAKQNTGVTRKANSNSSELLGKTSFHSHNLRSQTQSALHDTLKELVSVSPLVPDGARPQTRNSKIDANRSGFEEQTTESLTDDQENIGTNKLGISKPISNPKSKICAQTDNSAPGAKKFSSSQDQMTPEFGIIPIPEQSIINQSEDQVPLEAVTCSEPIPHGPNTRTSIEKSDDLNAMLLKDSGSRTGHGKKKKIEVSKSNSNPNSTLSTKSGKSDPVEKRSSMYNLRGSNTRSMVPTVEKRRKDLRQNHKLTHAGGSSPNLTESNLNPAIPILTGDNSDEPCDETCPPTRNHRHPKKIVRTGVKRERSKKKTTHSRARGSRNLGNEEENLKPFKCNECDWRFALNSKLTKHKRVHSGERPFECDECGKCFKRAYSLTEHKRTHIGLKPFKCDECEKCFTKSDALKVHKRSHTGETPFQCDVCDESFARSEALKQHKRSHTGETPYKCDVCDQTLTTAFGLSLHKRTHTGEKSYQCEECGKRFRVLSHLHCHKRSHTGEKRFECVECRKRFMTRRMLTNHGSIHTGLKLFRCTLCEKSFRTDGILASHQRVHTGVRPFKCDVCEGSFSTKISMQNHMGLHTGDGRFRCEECGHLAKTEKSLNSHKKIHTAERVFVCEVCGKGFLSNRYLKLHQRIHTEDKLFKCGSGTCDGSFKTMEGLSQHKKTHFKCKVCKKGFLGSRDLAKHEKSHTTKNRKHR